MRRHGVRLVVLRHHQEQPPPLVRNARLRQSRKGSRRARATKAERKSLATLSGDYHAFTLSLGKAAEADGGGPPLLLAASDAPPRRCFSYELRQQGFAKQGRNAATTGFFAKAPVSERRLDITGGVNSRWLAAECLGPAVGAERRCYWQQFA